MQTGFLYKADEIKRNEQYALAIARYDNGGDKEIRYKLHTCDINTGLAIDAGLLFKRSEMNKMKTYIIDCMMGFSAYEEEEITTNEEGEEKRITKQSEIACVLNEVQSRIERADIKAVTDKTEFDIHEIYMQLCLWVKNEANKLASFVDGEGYYCLEPETLSQVTIDICGNDRRKELYKYFSANGLYRHDVGRHTVHVNASKKMNITKQGHYVCFWNLLNDGEDVA